MLAAGSLAESQLPSDLKAQLWPAKWITSGDAPARDESVLYFRKRIQLAGPPPRYVINVSADNKYVLYVNGQRVGSGPARSDLAHWHYETFDVGPLLKAGENVFAAVVWNFGSRSALAQLSDRTSFLLGGATEVENAVNTGTDWDVAAEKAIRTLPKPQELGGYYYAAEPCVRIDGAKYAWGWNSNANPTQLEWKKAVAIGSGARRGASLQENNWQLTADPLPQMTMEQQPMGTVVRNSGAEVTGGATPTAEYKVPPHSHATLLLDRGHLTTAYPEFTANGGAGASVRLKYAEALLDAKDEKGNRNEIEGKHIVGVYDEFILDGAKDRTYQPLVWRTWRYLQIDVTTADEPLQLTHLQSWFSAFPFEEKAKFASDEPDLEKIWQIGWRTARLDAHDTYMDTPYWEQMQYIGDTRIQALISYSVAGDDRLARQAITAFNNSRIPDGITLSRYPTSMFQAIPTFSLLWIGMIHDFYMYRDDPAFVREQLAGTRTTLDWFLRHQRPDGLLDALFWWPFVDWGTDFGFGIPPEDPDGGSTSMALQFVEALRNAADLETALGDPARAGSVSRRRRSHRRRRKTTLLEQRIRPLRRHALPKTLQPARQHSRRVARRRPARPTARAADAHPLVHRRRLSHRSQNSADDRRHLLFPLLSRARDRTRQPRRSLSRSPRPVAHNGFARPHNLGRATRTNALRFARVERPSKLRPVAHRGRHSPREARIRRNHDRAASRRFATRPSV